MTLVSRTPVFCTACQAFGIVANGGGVCTVCEGAGELPRIFVQLKIVAASELSPEPDISFKRLAVMLSEQTDDGQVLLRGVTDSGIGLVAAMPAARFAEIRQVEFIESSVGWLP
jgi:hypothetical protein